MTPAVAAIVGPTAAGKSELAVEVGAALRAEIVSVDSMQIYAGMDAGTDKPTPEMRARVPHHLVDVRPPAHELTVSEFQGLARAAIAEIAARGRLVLLVGGSGLYFRAVVDDLRFPPRSPELRAALEREARVAGAGTLYERLRALDAPAAARIHPGNVRRIVRALEAIHLTGRPFSEAAAWDRYESVYRLAVAGITRSRRQLHERITARVDRMLASGLVEEAGALGPLGPTARQALGYRQVLEAPSRASERDIRDEIVRATKRFARRQESWFRADPRVRWFDAAAPDVGGRIAAYFAAALEWAVP